MTSRERPAWLTRERSIQYGYEMKQNDREVSEENKRRGGGVSPSNSVESKPTFIPLTARKDGQ